MVYTVLAKARCVYIMAKVRYLVVSTVVTCYCFPHSQPVHGKERIVKCFTSSQLIVSLQSEHKVVIVVSVIS